jgi:hypothetical protein
MKPEGMTEAEWDIVLMRRNDRAARPVYHEEGVATTIAEVATSMEGNRSGASCTPGVYRLYTNSFLRNKASNYNCCKTLMILAK